MTDADLSEEQLIGLLREAKRFPDDWLRRKQLANAMRNVDWNNYQRFRNELADLLENVLGIAHADP